MERRATMAWMAAAGCAALLLAAASLAVWGADAKGIHVALRATARLAFLLFWPAYAGSALARLVPGPVFRPLARHGRDFGLAFASALLVHLGLVGWLYQISPQRPFSRETFIFFGIAAGWTYVLALLSIPWLRQVIGMQQWRLLRTLGLEYVALAFLVDFRANPMRGGFGHVLAYLPFFALLIFGAFMRLLAWSRARFAARAESVGCAARVALVLPRPGTAGSANLFRAVPARELPLMSNTIKKSYKTVGKDPVGPIKN